MTHEHKYKWLEYSELRHRGRLVQLEAASTFLPERSNIPVEYQILRTWRQVAEFAAQAHIEGAVPTGAKIGFGSTVLGEGGRQISFALTYVVDRP